MKLSKKAISTALVSTVVVSSGIIGMANNEGSKGIDLSKNDENMNLDITSAEDGRSFHIKINNASSIYGFSLTFEIEGNVKYDGIDFSELIKTDGLTNVDATTSGNVTTVKIVVTSGSDLTKGGVLNIGTVKISGDKDEDYTIKNASIVATAMNYDSVKNQDMKRTGDTGITVGEGGNGVVDPGDGEDGNTDPDNPGEPGAPVDPENPEGPVEPENPIEPEKPDTGGNNGGSSGGNNGSTESGGKVNVTQMVGTNRYDTAAKISQMGWKNGADTVIIVNGDEKHMVDGLSATPFARVKDAPLLLADKGKLPSATVKEMKRLNPSKVYIIGGTASVSNDVVNDIKDLNSKTSVSRISGDNRYETALAVAKEIDKVSDVDKIYVSGGTGEVDALSIASVAGREKAPILLTDVNGMNESTKSFIKSEGVKDAYFIGGKQKISDKAISQVDALISKDVSKNRIAGDNRKDTNAKVIEKFYTGSELNGAIITKDDVIVDALTVGSFAAKNDMPVVIGKESLSTAQKKALLGKKTENIYQAGGGTKQSVIDTLKTIFKGN